MYEKLPNLHILFLSAHRVILCRVFFHVILRRLSSHVILRSEAEFTLSVAEGGRISSACHARLDRASHPHALSKSKPSNKHHRCSSTNYVCEGVSKRRLLKKVVK